VGFGLGFDTQSQRFLASIGTQEDICSFRSRLEEVRTQAMRHDLNALSQVFSTAISQVFEMELGVPEVALISGHKDYRMLARHTHLRAEDVGKKTERLQAAPESNP